MSIDWITVAAQVANFLVLVWLLKRFLYRPILDGIDAREAEIAGRMQVAERARAEAEATEAEYRTRMDKLRSEQASVAEAARQKAETARDAMLAQALDRIEAERRCLTWPTTRWRPASPRISPGRSHRWIPRCRTPPARPPQQS